jgi:hypothetical protein
MIEIEITTCSLLNSGKTLPPGSGIKKQGKICSTPFRTFLNGKIDSMQEKFEHRLRNPSHKRHFSGKLVFNFQHINPTTKALNRLNRAK